MKAQVVKCCHQFLEMQEEDIQPYLATFVTAIWGLLVACTSRSGQDNLALSAIAFLTTVGRSTHHRLFATGDTIRQVRKCALLLLLLLHGCMLRDDGGMVTLLCVAFKSLMQTWTTR
jgi:hypothetical protein